MLFRSELSGEQQLALVRAYVKDNFVDKGMCADFAIHDKGTCNPHVHIMLTLRPLKENGQWGAKCRKAYDLDENGQRIPDGKGGWKNHREDTTDWNDKGNVEIKDRKLADMTKRTVLSVLQGTYDKDRFVSQLKEKEIGRASCRERV